MHGADSPVSRQELGDRLRVRAVRAHAPGKRPNAAHDEPAVEWRRDRAGHRLRHAQRIGEYSRVAQHERATEQVAVAAEVLGGGVHRDVGAELEGALEHGGRPSVVHHAERAARVRQVGEGGDVHDADERIGRRLHPDDLRRRPHGALHRVEVGHVHDVGEQPPAGKDLSELAEGAVVGVVRREHMVARRQRLEHRERGRRAGAIGDGGRASFERGECLLQRVAIGVRRPAVDVASAVRSVHIALEGAAQVDGRGDGAAHRVGSVAGMDGEGLDAHGGM